MKANSLLRIKVINLINVVKKYDLAESQVTVINGITLEIKNNEYVAILGKSGSGKSTLLNLIGSLDNVTEGNIVVNDIDITNISKKELANYRNREIGFIFQRFNLEAEYNVFQNVELPLLISKQRNYKEKIYKILEKLQIADKLNVKIKFLSGGEQQRVAIARAIINDPPIILADEPCGNLDTYNSENVMNILDMLHKEGKTIVLVTHDLLDAQRAQRIITISNGEIIENVSNI